MTVNELRFYQNVSENESDQQKYHLEAWVTNPNEESITVKLRPWVNYTGPDGERKTVAQNSAGLQPVTLTLNASEKRHVEWVFWWEEYLREPEPGVEVKAPES